MPTHHQRYAQYQGESEASPAQDMLSEACETTDEFVRQNPATATLVALGVGVGVGFLLSSLMTQRHHNWYDSYLSNLPNLPSNLGSNFSWPRTSARWSDAVSRMLPEALHQCSSSARRWF